MNYKFKIGQQVMIRKNFTIEDCRGAGYVEEMEELRGKIVTITGRDRNNSAEINYYKLKEETHNIVYAEKQLTLIIMDENEAIKKLIEGHITPKIYEQIVKGSD